MAAKFTSIDSWSALDVSHLVYAYRKAKADCFFERTISMGERFVRFEGALAENLQRMLRLLSAGKLKDLLPATPMQVRVVAKKLSFEPKSGSADEPDTAATAPAEHGHAFFSDPERAFERHLRRSTVTPEFRAIGDFEVEVHVISALWLSTVGAKLDAALSSNAYGARLRRVRPEPGSPEGATGPVHMEALGSFEPYFHPYKRWRQGGLEAIRGELKADRQVVALSLDLANYYHQIDPSFLTDKEFHRSIGVELSQWEAEFNALFTQFLMDWSQHAAALLRLLGVPVVGKGGGIPIGLSATRVISNVLLAELDAEIESGLAPVYYGRYVDDIFLVFRDPGRLLEATDALSYIAGRVKIFPKNVHGGTLHLTLPGEYQGGTLLALQPAKQKAFFLAGKAGLDLLDSIEAQIRSVSSERRLMPSPDRLSSMASAKVLSAAGTASEEADTLRRADGLSVRRLSWALQLRAVEILARDLRHQDWVDERLEFYRFSRSHILRPDKILDHFDYLPRLVSLAVALTDWSEAKLLLETARRALDELALKCRTARVNGLHCPSTSALWTLLNATLTDLVREAVLTSVRWSSSTCEPVPLSHSATQVCELVGVPEEEIVHRALALREIDWARAPYKLHLRIAASRHRPLLPGEEWVRAGYRHTDDLVDFLDSCRASPSAVAAARVRAGLHATEASTVSLLPYIFPTRPYTTQEISLFLPEKCVLGVERECATNWARYTRAVRGIWVWGGGIGVPSHLRSGASESKRKQVAYLGGELGSPSVRLGISSLLTRDESWRAAASGRSDLSRRRYKHIETVVNHAITATPKPTYLLLPELSLPERWINTVSGMLANAGIGLIAGLDYQLRDERTIHSSAVLVLKDTRLGYPANVEVRQVKSLPAPGEDKLLQKDFGREWTELPLAKPVYIHNGFAFGVLICSELQNANHRLEFQGDVDCLMVLSWNQDIDTFSALVESASLDVHASVALVNNRKYGDSRVRVPAKQSHLRDVCRLRGGRNDHVVVVDIQIDQLRAFQSRAKRWPEDGDPYKPVPEAFKSAKYRKTVPQ